MAVFGVRIVKQETFEGSMKEFGNTYHYETSVVEPFEDEAVAIKLRDAEEKITSLEVEFTRWESWGPTDGTQTENVMRERKPFPTIHAGLGQSNPSMYREVCAVVAWPLPRSEVHNTRRWLRKFIRCPGIASAVLSPDVMSGRIAIPAALKTALVAYGNEVKSVITPLATVDLVTKSGVGITGDPLGRDFLKTREIGR